MIGFLSGVVRFASGGSVVIDVGGIGYAVRCGANLTHSLKLGHKCELWIETTVRENDISLYGFKDLGEKECFKHLVHIKGVGSKIAMQVTDALGHESIYMAIQTKNSSALSAVPGIGPKLATRIVNELAGSVDFVLPVSHGVVADAVSALVHLGLPRAEAHQLVEVARTHDESADLNELIKRALTSYQSGKNGKRT